MKNQYSFVAYILIGFGIYFLFNQFHVPLLNNVPSSVMPLAIIGISLLIQYFKSKDPFLLISGTILCGIAIHLYGLTAYQSSWNEHWAIYILIIGIALFLNFLQTKKGLIISVMIIGSALLFLASSKVNDLFEAFFSLFGMATTYWPLIFIGFGIFLLKTKK